MPVSQKMGGDEKIGFSIKSSERRKHRAGKRTYVTEQLLGHVRNRDRLSMDRISLADENGDLDKVVDAAKRRIPESDRFFRGWQTFRVANLRNRKFTVQGSVDPGNPGYPYHADVIVPTDVLENRPKKEQIIREMVNSRYWYAYPQPAVSS